MELVLAPFAPAQIALLRSRQAERAFHPYTCPVHQASDLQVGRDGLRCPEGGCEYRQPWVHAEDLTLRRGGRLAAFSR